jgi:hypothetical protein
MEEVGKKEGWQSTCSLATSCHFARPANAAVKENCFESGSSNRKGVNEINGRSI